MVELTIMNETKLLLNAYYETLYELLEANKDRLATRIEQLLAEEIEDRGFGNFDEDKFSAYRDVCLAFVDERMETYNPIGIQYTFDRIRAREAAELELQLNWYDSQAEFEALVEAASSKVEAAMAEENLRLLAEELIKQAGAFPDKSIISAYQAGPALSKLPDYIVARAIEEIVR
jgi:predicted metal-dependent phosphoesterase TrpH